MAEVALKELYLSKSYRCRQLLETLRVAECDECGQEDFIICSVRANEFLHYSYHEVI